MMGLRECGRIDDWTVDNDKLGHFYNAVKGALTWRISKQTWRKSTRKLYQNETSYLGYGVGVNDEETTCREENHCKNYRGINYWQDDEK